MYIALGGSSFIRFINKFSSNLHLNVLPVVLKVTVEKIGTHLNDVEIIYFNYRSNLCFNGLTSNIKFI